MKPGIQERGTECGECSLGFLGNVIILTFRGMFQRIPGNVQRDPGECLKRSWGMFEEILGNVQEDSGEIPGMYKKILGNIRKDSGECSRRFWGMLKKISGNLNLDLFCEILLQIFVAYRHFTQNQFQKFKLQNAEYKTLCTD